MSTLVQTAWLDRVMDAALAEASMTESHRREVVSGVLFGSLRGLDTHGVTLFRTYLAELRSGRANAHPRFQYRQRRPAIARLDADGALGMVAGFEAARRAASLAKEHGVGVVVVANSNHFGAASLYTTALARQDLVGLAMTNSDALVLPVNGRVPRLGTNPISVAAAGERDDLFCADLATSQGSFLRTLALRASGQSPPAGVVADASGRDAACSGAPPAALLPLGGHKGQCLGMMVTVLCALLGGAPLDWEIANLFEGPFDRPRGISHLLLAIDVAAVADLAVFRARLSGYLEAFRASDALDGLRVSCPGDTEEEQLRIRSREGIPLGDADLAFLQELERGRAVAAAPSREAKA